MLMFPVCASLNCKRFKEARLQAVSSRNIYSEHGLEARIGPAAGLVCQSFIVVLKCRPGSADAQAAWEMFSHRSRAFTTFITEPSRRAVRFHAPSSSTACR